MSEPNRDINPLLLEIPTELNGDRLTLRVPRAGDGAVAYPSVRDSLPELKQWMPWATDAYNEQSGEEWCRKAAANFLSREQLQFLIFLRSDGRHIGNVGAFKFNWEVPSCEIGYWLHTAHTRHGYMTEAVGILKEMLRIHVHVRRVEIRSDAENLKSRRVAELAGFQLEGILRNDCVAVGGRLRDSCVFSSIFNSCD
ncbi:MAG: GNAT family N-acetyltransferase [Tepidisphaeraceae bacterium]|jgi:RimJ/RimL family protein N-acetyltransferase